MLMARMYGTIQKPRVSTLLAHLLILLTQVLDFILSISIWLLSYISKKEYESEPIFH